MLFFIFWPLPEKLLDCPKNNYFARLWGCSPQPPSSYANSKRIVGNEAPPHAKLSLSWGIRAPLNS